MAGAAAATVLARAGRRVTLVEREAAPKHKVCGEFLSVEALTLLKGLGVVPAEHGAERIGTVRLCSAHHVTESALPFAAASLTRRCLDGLLLDTAEESGVCLLRNTSVEVLAPTGGGWQATLSTGQTLWAPRVILATGKHDLRGFPRPPGTQGDLVAFKMYWRLAPEQAAGLQHAVELLVHPEGYTGLQLVEDGAANLCGLVRRRHLAKVGGWPGLFAELLASNPHAAQRLRGAEPLLDKPLAISSIPYGYVRRQALAERLWAVGDQAAVIPSFTGDGMSIALYSGLRAAQSLLAHQSSEQFQRGLCKALRWQVRRATLLSRALVHMPGVLAAGARVWPGSLPLVARATRLREPALWALSSPR